MRKVLRRLRRWPVLAAAGVLAILGFFVFTNLADGRRVLARAEDEVELARELFGGRQYDAAKEHLGRARAHVEEARRIAGRLSLRVLDPIPVIGSGGRGLRSATDAGRAVLDAGDLLVEEAAEVELLLSRADGQSLSALYDAAGHAEVVLEQTAVHLRKASDALGDIAGAWLPQVGRPARAVHAQLADDLGDLERLRRGVGLARELTAPEADLRLLVLAQDTMELRATGGYVGSFGVLHIADGMVNLERYQSFEELPAPNPPLDPPPDLAKVLDRPWNLANANWWPDFPTSAATARELFKRQGGAEVDGVVAVTELAMGRLLGVLGPIQLPSYADPVVEDGFGQRVLYEVELKRPLDVPRKKFLAELAQAVLQTAVSSGERVPDMAASLAGSVGAGDVQLWFADPNRQAAVADTVIAGSLPKTDGDFLMLSEANMSAGKANADLVREADYAVTRRVDGRLEARLRIHYRNEGAASEINPYYHGWLSVYVPRGSDPASGKKAVPAADAPYDVISATVFVEPEGTEELELSWVLPESISDNRDYHLTWLRQAGTPADRLTATAGVRSVTGDPDGRVLELSARL